MDQIGPSTRLALAMLATWRVTHLLSNEDGPADLIFRLRAMLGSSIVGRLMDCFYCLSIWVAAAIAATLTRRFVDWLLVCLALSGAGCLLERATQRPTQERTSREEGEIGYGMLRSEERESEEQHAVGQRP